MYLVPLPSKLYYISASLTAVEQDGYFLARTRRLARVPIDFFFSESLAIIMWRFNITNLFIVSHEASLSPSLSVI